MSAVRIDGEERRLKLTLGALAEIERELGGGDFERLKARLAAPSVGDLLVMLRALIEGGGARLSLEALKAADIDLAEAAGAVAEAFGGLKAGRGDDGAKKPAGGSPSRTGSAPESSS